MKSQWIAVGVLMLNMLVGCGPVETDEAPVSEEMGQLSKPLQAAAACQSPKTCADNDNCTGWSSWSQCGLTACNKLDGNCRVCGDPGEPCQQRGGQRQLMVRHRVCLNDSGESCTEYQNTTVGTSICGCYDL